MVCHHIDCLSRPGVPVRRFVRYGHNRCKLRSDVTWNHLMVTTLGHFVTVARTVTDFRKKATRFLEVVL